MKILLLEPYFTGSHKTWAEGYQKHSEHEVDILGLPGHFWKWRMHGGAVTLAKEFLNRKLQADFLLATDMLDLTTFLSLTRRQTATTPTAVYFHENQLSYPWSPDDRDVVYNRDKHYGFINYVSALAADRVFFNSKYHRHDFLKELKLLLKHFPDHNNFENIEVIAEKSEVLSLGLDLERFDKYAFVKGKAGFETPNEHPTILWNHRWEYDKNPREFFKAMFLLSDKGLDFNIAILGECFGEQPDEFRVAKEKLGDKIVHFGYVEKFADYAKWLWQTDILPVTSKQDFFGASVVEAIYCKCLPILPDRLAYPELIQSRWHSTYFYADFDELLRRLEDAILNFRGSPSQSLRRGVEKFKWSELAPGYDKVLEDICGLKLQRRLRLQVALNE